MSLNVKRPYYRLVDGFRIPGAFDPECFRQAVAYRPQPVDLFVATYMKCGTTWMQQIIYLLAHKGESPGIACANFAFGNYLEFFGTDNMDLMKRSVAIKTHLPFELTPYSSEARYICVTRNPKDCCASFFHHTKNLSMYKFQDCTFDDFFELFVRGETDGHDFFDHLLGWYAHRNDPNVLFVTYESMKADLEGAIKRVTKFAGPQFEESVLDPHILARVVKFSSFDHMKSEHNQSLAETLTLPAGDDPYKAAIQKRLGGFKGRPRGAVESIDFIRKGEVGDWRNYFSEEQNRRMNERIAEKTRGSDVMSLWKDGDIY